VERHQRSAFIPAVPRWMNVIHSRAHCAAWTFQKVSRNVAKVNLPPFATTQVRRLACY
jgi:hypothetical protein